MVTALAQKVAEQQLVIEALSEKMAFRHDRNNENGTPVHDDVSKERPSDVRRSMEEILGRLERLERTAPLKPAVPEAPQTPVDSAAREARTEDGGASRVEPPVDGALKAAPVPSLRSRRLLLCCHRTVWQMGRRPTRSLW
jgi:hypothetical protein